ncbi:MAG: ribosomal protein S18-alanine N-acetyltransferase [Nitrospirales bacterium]
MAGLDDICITQATIDDLDELESLENRTFSVPWSRKAFEAELNGNEFSYIYIARGGDSIGELSSTRQSVSPRMVGYICVWVVFEELRFMNIAIEADMRRRGIASKLLRKSLDVGINQGGQRALLEVRVSNEAAQALYMHFGFTSYGSRRHYYTNPNEDAMLMTLEPITLPST